MNETPRYATLRDYLRVLRSHRWLILGLTVLFAGAAFVVSSVQTKKYTAEADLSFRDISQDLNLVGQQSLPELAPDQRAAVNAGRVTRPDVVNKVRQSLNTNLTTDQIQSEISTQVGARTNFVLVQATDQSPQFAARLANAFAHEVQVLDLAQVRGRIDHVIAGLRENLKRARKSSDQSSLITQQVNESQIAQLETVRELAHPVEIARAAQAPQQASSPRVKRNTILGALVGLAFGLLVAFLRDSLDRRLRNTDEVQAELQLPVIGRVPQDALGHAGFANGAVKDAETHLEAFRMLRTNLEFLQADSPMTSVMVTSGAPEEGKSTVAMALAGAAAIAGKRTLLVECDLRRPCFADRLEIEPKPGLTDYLVGQATPAEVLQVVKLSPPASVNGGNGKSKDAGEDLGGVADMVCITSGSTAPLPAEMLGSDKFAKLLEKVSQAYDIVVLDTSPLLSVVDALELAPQVDGMIVCIRLSKTTREEARAVRDALGHLPPRPTGVVVTGLTGGDQAYYGYAYGGPRD